MADSSNSIVCPHCNTRLRFAAGIDFSSHPCPECGMPLGSSAHEPATSKLVPSGTNQKRLGVLASVIVITFGAAYWLTRSRPESTATKGTSNQVASSKSIEGTAPINESDATGRPALTQPAITNPKRERGTAKQPVGRDSIATSNQQSAEIAPAAPEPTVAIPTTQPTKAVTPLEPPPQVAVVEPKQVPTIGDSKPDSAPRSAITDAAVVPASAPQPPVIPPTSKVEMPSRAELIQKVLQQRIASIQVAPKTTVRQFARELNEMSNGLLEFDEQISQRTWDKELTLSLKNATMKELLMAFAQASGLKLDIGLETIALHATDPMPE